MPRPIRVDAGNVAYHVINRANARSQIFEAPKDFQSFEEVLLEAVDHTGMRLCAYCVMPNHWHMVVYPREDGDLAVFMGWLTMTHTQRWHVAHHTVGTGHLYQGRYKSFPIQTDNYFLTACRYVERNALRARLVATAEDWRWSSAWRREFGSEQQKALLSEWPVAAPENYRSWLNDPQPEEELEILRRCVNRGQPFGNSQWVALATKRFGLESTFRDRGRPKNRID